VIGKVRRLFKVKTLALGMVAKVEAGSGYDG
jgi:hypothetical protein